MVAGIQPMGNGQRYKCAKHSTRLRGKLNETKSFKEVQVNSVNILKNTKKLELPTGQGPAYYSKPLT